MKNLPGIDMRILFGFVSSAIFMRIEFKSAVLYPASSSTAFIISVVEDFPLVPVTPITNSFREGKS
jgi:hypothetical protein